jgi:gliding motility-associated protein GldM
MASGKQTPRQKMINLMYLVFIAMLALNMSKEVLSAFGMITEQTQENTVLLESRVESFKTAIDLAVQEGGEGFTTEFKITADSIQIISDNFDNYINSLLPNAITKTIYNKESSRDSVINDYEVMDKPDYFNTLWFANSDGKLTDASTLDKDEIPLGDRSGEGFIKKIDEFKTQFTNLVIKFSPESDPNYVEVVNEDTTDGEPQQFTAGFKTGKGGTYSDIIAGVNDIFSTNDVVNRDGDATSWIEYHFFGFPEVASTTKLALLQSNIRSAQAELYSAMLGGQFKLNSTLANFDAYVVADRSSYYTGSNFTGKIVLGKKSDDLNPESAFINNVELLENENAINPDGSINLDFRVGSLGPNTISGNVIFMEDGQEISIPVNQTYEVVNKPNKASISADKMRVVYIGVENPISISFSGIDNNNVSATAPGLSRIGSSGSYVLDLTEGVPTAMSQQMDPNDRKVKILVRGKLEGGEVVNDNAAFEVKPLPKPIANIAGNTDQFSYTRAALSTARIKSKFDNAFAYQLDLNVFGFDVDVPGQPTVTVRGNRFDDNARSALRSARRGAFVTISNIKVKAAGTTVDLQEASPLIIKISD